MKSIKKYLGIIWMAIGPVAIYFLIKMAASEIAAKPVIDTKIQWGVFVVIFIPIAIGMVLFGYYVLTGEYEE
jgi:predicted Na+-dependent transporter